MYIVRFQGGFANQLFQLCFYEKLRQLYGDNNVFADIAHYKKCHDHGGFKIAPKYKLNYIKELPSDYIEIREDNFDITNLKKEKNYYFKGYWQNEAFFPDDLGFLRIFFEMDCLSPKNRNILDEMQKEESVSIHVRRGDYLDNYLHGYISNKSYIINAIEYVCQHVENPVFYVFSDDIEWCQKNLCVKDWKMIFVTGNEMCVENDILMMSSCKHNIISNSSFSWWAQKLNLHSGKMVISPEYWYNDDSFPNNLISKDFITCNNLPKFTRKMNHPKFSIIVPVYNSESTIRRCSSSILNQNYDNFEVVFIDDGSSDGSYELLKCFEKNDSRVKVIHKEKNESLLCARITGMRNAIGEYIVFVDSDDYLSNDALAVLNNKLDENDVDILEYGYYEEPGKILFSENVEFDNCVNNILMQKNNHSIWKKCYSKKLVNRLLLETEEFYCNMSEDEYFSVLMFDLADSYDYIIDGIYHYMTCNGMSKTKNMSMTMLDNAITSINNKDYYLKKYLEKKGYDHIENTSIGFIVNMCLKQDTGIIEKINMLKKIDDKFSTEYAKMFEHKLQNDYMIIEDFNSISFKSQIVRMLKYVLRRIKKKICN